MISHQHKCIFIHIPKCAGSSIKEFLFRDQKFDWKIADYEHLYGWCPKRKIHLQHATSEQLIETNLISPKIWKEYFKFTVVRNPWDRAYSDYMWLQKDRKIKGSFKEYIFNLGAFENILIDNSTKEFRGDHKTPQTDFFDIKGTYELDFIGRFESLYETINELKNTLLIPYEFKSHVKKNKNRVKKYQYFYNNQKRKWIQEVYANDIHLLNYKYETVPIFEKIKSKFK